MITVMFNMSDTEKSETTYMVFHREITKLVTTSIFLEYFVAVEKNMEKFLGIVNILKHRILSHLSKCRKTILPLCTFVYKLIFQGRSGRIHSKLITGFL